MKTSFAFALVLLSFAAVSAEEANPSNVRVVYRPVDRIVYQPKTVVVERVVTNVIEKIVEKPVEVIVEKIVSAPASEARPVEKVETNYVEKVRFVERVVTNVVEKPVEKVVEHVVTNTVEKVVEVPVEKVAEHVVTNTVEKVVEVPVEKVVEVPVEKVVERVVTNTVEKVVEMPVEKVVERVVTNTVEKVVEMPVEKVVERVVTNTVEKVVEQKIHDFAEEDRLRDEKTAAIKKSDTLEANNTFLANDNEKLKQELAAAQERCRRLERLIPKGQVPKQGTGRQANITSKSTYYDRKEGFAVFDGKVHVDDERYQLHADKAYVFMDGTNNLKRLVALGNVAMTNETKRAYGIKASYYRESGMVILYGDANRPAEVRDEAKYDDQSVIGEKIKFWIDKEQVEVIKSKLSAPVGEGTVPFAPKL